MVEWSYGITTCNERLTTTLPSTIESLAKAGFDKPHLFIDGGSVFDLPLEYLDYSTTCRKESVNAYGNWILSAWELYVSKPKAKYYAIFQDDIIVCKGIKEYIEATSYPKQSYLNLFSFASNESMIFKKPKGWHKSDQLGKGAVALVFDHLALTTLLKQSHTVNKPQLPKGHKNVDGAIQHALVVEGKFTEYIHSPSLVQHIGKQSSIGNSQHPEAKTFQGENWNVLKEAYNV